ncbi:RING finger protein 208-like [Syngnathoides biaculeatus]|uniref:RING finger protein 208-like n=1 Tax=Syngnathoides biaculeatus TaxID=300417 RepID=UPI002ADDC6AE|nr:RING finger protein 208-like [Syngnathoides biaculeatus]
MDSSKDCKMLPREDLECVVCCHGFSRRQRVPRLLHCGHSFCTPCLEKLAKVDAVIRTICCPLCRWISCTRASQPLPGVLWVNTEIWDQVAGEEQTKRRTTAEEDSEEVSNQRLIRPVWLDSNNAVLKSTLQKMFNCLGSHERHVQAF